MKEIVQEGADVLREIAEPVADAAFGSNELKELVNDMAKALDKEPDGVALAAPQIGIGRRLFIVRMDRVEPPAPEATASQASSSEAGGRAAVVDVYVNPEIVKTSRRRQTADEGCLSVRGIYGTTHRHERVTIRARGVDGTSFTRGAGGLLAQIFEHEVDHLNGVLFIDGAEDMVEVRPFEGSEALASEHEHAA